MYACITYDRIRRATFMYTCVSYDLASIRAVLGVSDMTLFTDRSKPKSIYMCMYIYIYTHMDVYLYIFKLAVEAQCAGVVSILC